MKRLNEHYNLTPYERTYYEEKNNYYDNTGLHDTMFVFVVGNIASNPQNHQKAIKYLDQKKANVLKLTALSTASSTAITMIPGDTATPIATKLADLTSWFC